MISFFSFLPRHLFTRKQLFPSLFNFYPSRTKREHRDHPMGKDFSDDQIKAMKDAFSLFDSDKDGRIAPSDLGVLMRALGGNPTQAQLAQIIKSEGLTAPYDVNRFLELMRAHLNTDPFDEPLRTAFKVIDKESTGRISVKELRHILVSIGEKLEGSEFDEWIKEVEVGPDGTFKYEDLIQKITAK